MTSSTPAAIRDVMDAWMRRHPENVQFSVKHDVAFCMHPDSVVGIDSAGAKVVEGMHATKTSVSTVAVKVFPGARTPPILPFHSVQKTVPPHVNVFPAPGTAQYRDGSLSMNPLAEAYLDEIMDWNANGIGESAAKEVMFDVLSALAACHSVGVAHCNVRPENIALMVTSHREDGLSPESRACLAGFKRTMLYNLKDPCAFQQARVEPGAAEFCSPESEKGGLISFPASDVGSAGLLLFHMLTGRHVISTKDWESCLDGISSPGQTLCRLLCSADPTSRPTAADAVKHEWFIDSIAVSLASATGDDAVSFRRARRKLFEKLTTPPPWSFVCSMRSRDLLGKGYHAAVYRGTWKSNDAPCAVKVISRGADRTRERRILLQMPPHPHVAVPPEVTRDTAGFRSVFVVPIADGFLHECKGVGSGLPEHIARRIFAEVVAAVAHCHAHGVCHLDIKPDNVMFIEGLTVLTDFGNGQVFDASLPPSLAITRFANEPRLVCLKTVKTGHRPRPYAPPELYRGGSGTYSLPLTDMWSLGALLHYLMTGQPVNRRDDGTTTLSPSLGHEVAKDMVTSLVQQRQADRPTAAVLSSHVWLQPPFPTPQEVYAALGLKRSVDEGVAASKKRPRE